MSGTLSLRLTDETPCSYLPDRRSRSAFVDPDTPLDAALMNALNHEGFRRAGRFVYRTACPGCHACHSYRVLNERFRPRRSQWRVQRRLGPDVLSIRLSDGRDDTWRHLYPLYARYIETRHADGDMYPPSRTQYEDFLAPHYSWVHYLQLIDRDAVTRGVMVYDRLRDGLSAVYSFFDPDPAWSGLGTRLILALIEQARDQALPYTYLGFWVPGSPKMDYKTRFHPAEYRDANGWHPWPGKNDAL